MFLKALSNFLTFSTCALGVAIDTFYQIIWLALVLMKKLLLVMPHPPGLHTRAFPLPRVEADLFDYYFTPYIKNQSGRTQWHINCQHI
jgi:hypothetical protein